jgi:DNA (cytosine-5)-methyltransferase 1
MRSVELFAGCGGLALGVARAGFKHDIIVEMDDDSVATLSQNKKRKVEHVRDWDIEQSDSRALDYTEMEDIALLSGGPPCQPFSIGGKHLGPKDPRNMWPEAVRAIREIRPKAFVLENVRGLFRPDFAKYLEYITLQLTHPNINPKDGETWNKHLARLREHSQTKRGKSGEYRVISRAINAADYGAPQKRHRAIFVGVCSEYGSDWEFPAATHSQEALAFSKHVDFSYWKRHDARRVSAFASESERRAFEKVRHLKQSPKERPWLTVRDAISDLPAPTESQRDFGHWQHQGAKAYPNHTGSHFDEPAKALKAGDHGVPGGENMLASKNGSVRYFTVREMARLQGFPDDYGIYGSWRAATRQLGNAVPTMVGEQIARAVLKILNRRTAKSG